MSTLIMLLQLIPALIKLVQAAEDLVPGSGQGQNKLDFVLGLILDVHDEAKTLIPQITAAVARIVRLANASGAFAHGKAGA